MYEIGVDIGGTNIKVGLVNDALEIIARCSVPFTLEGPQAVAERLQQAIADVCKQAQACIGDVRSIGIVIPGSIDATGEIVINAHNLDFHDVPFRSMMQQRFADIPVRMANDADAAALAELYKGAFVGCRTAVLFTLGTGLGGGIILNGKMFSGGTHQGVELGHCILVDGGEPCTCGNRGCMEAYCSATALAREGARAMAKHPDSLLAVRSGGDTSKVDAKLVTDCAKEGDAAAVAVFDEYIGHLSSACASIFNILDPEVLAIGGGLCAAGEFLFQPLREKTARKCFFKTHGEIVPAVMGNDAGIIGAAMLYRDTQI